jgi:FkbM family methyltransferase
MIKKLVKSALNKVGYDLRKVGKYPLVFEGGLFDTEYLSRLLQPRTLIDVGVGYGTHPLYEAFPNADLILIEPLIEYEDSVAKIMNNRNGRVFYKAVGNAKGILNINVDTANLELSSFADRTPMTQSGNSIEQREVEVTTLDAIFEECCPLKHPIVLKIDTEGNELSVLEGAKSALQSVDCVIAEVSIAKRFENSYEIEALIEFMSENGFYLYSFLFIAHVIGEERPRFADIVFMRKEK